MVPGDRLPGSPGWEPDEDDLARAGRPSQGVVLRALSVVPFLLAAAVAMIALITWFLVAVFGFDPPRRSGDAAAAGREPIWRWITDHNAGEVLVQILFFVGVALIPAAIIALAGWATMYGFRERTNPFFWPVLQVLYGILAIGMIVMDRTASAWLDETGISARDWWFAFGVIAYGMVLAGLRIRRQRELQG